MTLEEVKQFLEDNREDEEVQNYVKGLVTPDRVKAFLESDEGKRVIQPKLDQYFTKGLETWKANNLQKIVDEEVQKKYPDEDEQTKRIKALEQKINQEENLRKRQEIKNKAMKKLTEEKYPVDLVEFLNASTEEELDAKVGTLKTTLNGWMETVLNEKFKESGRTPRKPGNNKDEKNNPWSEKNWNLTEQGRLMREDPELAKYYRENSRR